MCVESKFTYMELPGGLVVRILCFNCRGHGFDPYSWDSDPACHGMWPKKGENSSTVKCIGFIYTVDNFHLFHTHTQMSTSR